MRNASLLFFLCSFCAAHQAFAQELDSTKYYRDKIKSIEARLKEMESTELREQLAEDSIDQSFQEAYKQRKVILFTGDLFLRVGTGSVAVDLGSNTGYFTGSTEIGLRFRSYFKGTSKNGIPYQKPVSLFYGVSWGPMLVGDNLIPNYLYFNFGGMLERVNSSIFLGGVRARNVSDDGAMNLYGVIAGFDGIATPTYVTFLKGDDFKYVFLVGFKISLSQVWHSRWIK